MERSRDGYRGRYRDRHDRDSTDRGHHDNRPTRGTYRGHSSHDSDLSGHYSWRSLPNNGYNYRSSRTSLHSRPLLSRNGPPTHYRHHRNDDYPLSSHSPPSPSNRTRRDQSNYYDDNHSPTSRFDRPPSRRETYSSLPGSLPGFLTGSSSYHSSSSQAQSLSRDRNAVLPSAQYSDIDRHRYPSSSSYRHDSSPPSASSYRNDRPMDYGFRNPTHEVYARDRYRSPSSPPSAPVSTRTDPYDDPYRTTDYRNRSERYGAPSNRTPMSSRDDPLPSSTYRGNSYRSSSHVSMSSSPSYLPREQYPSDMNYRPISQSRDYENLSSSSSRNSSMDQQDSFSRTSRDRTHQDYHSSYSDRPNLKRPSSRYDDDGPAIPSKRPARR